MRKSRFSREQLETFCIQVKNFMYRIDEIRTCTLGKNKTYARNSQLNNSCTDDTCYVVATGPSLKYEKNLDKLKERPVFSVNQLYRSSIFKEVCPDYHIMMDPLFFNLKRELPEDADTIIRMQEVTTNERIKFFFPIQAYAKVASLIGIKENFYFLNQKYALHNGYSHKMRIDRYLPTNSNVVQTAISLAIAMGYKRIVLLGVDSTGIMDNYIRRSPDSNAECFSHIYNYTKEETLRMKKVHAAHSNEMMLGSFYRMFKDYRHLVDYCDRNSIHLLNASQETALDMIEFTTLDDELQKVR